MDGLVARSCFREGLEALRARRPEDAIPLLRQAIEEGDTTELASLNLAFALMDAGQIGEARARLHELRPHFEWLPDWHLRAGHLATLARDWPAARMRFVTAARLAPDNAAARVGMALVERSEGHLQAALSWLAEARLLAPDDVVLLRELAELQLAAGLAEASAKTSAELLARPDCPPCVGALRAAALMATMDEATARACLEAEAVAEPFSAARATALAALHEAAGRPDEALAQWRLADLLAPDDGEVLAAMGRLLNASRQRAEARPVLERAIALRPLDPAPRLQLCQVLFREHRFPEADRLYTRTIADFGPCPVTLEGKALVLTSQARQAEAAACLDALAEREATFSLTALAGIAPYAMETAGAERLHERALRAKAQLAQQSSDLERCAEGPERRLRVGFLSSSFGKHPVGWLTIGGIEGLPRDAFEVVIVSLRDREGQINRRYRARADEWHDLPEALSDTQLAARLRALELDILVDLGGHGDGGRLRALRHRAAPVQMKWVGAQSGPTGTPNIDWMIADRWEIPPELERFYTERALRLRDGYVSYSPPPYAPAVGPLPALRNGHLTFGCFNNLAKLTPEVIGCWARIMAALPTARLVLRNHGLGDAETRDGFLARAAGLGLDLARVEAHGPVNHETLLDAYSAVDISLDPFPYTGGLTVCESLWMGVPVLTLAGESFAGRHAVSHLSNAGLSDWVARSPDEYVVLAVSRAADLDVLARLRAGLRAQVAASPLGDAPRFAESLAMGLRAAWRDACGRHAA